MSISTGAAGTIERPQQRTSAAVTKLAGGGAALLFASAAGNALSYGFGIFVARALGSEQFGLYTLGLTVFNLLALFAPLALDTGLLKFVSGQLSSGEGSLARRTMITAGMIALSSGLLASVGLILFAPLIASIYHKPALTGVLFFFAAALPFAVLGTVILGALQAFQTVRYTVLIKYLWEPAGKFLLAILAIVLGLGLYGVLCGMVVVFAVSALIGLGCLIRAIPAQGGRTENKGEAFRVLAAFCAPLIMSNLFGILAPRSDMLILGYWVNAEQVGIYNAAFQTSGMIALILGAFDTAVAPVIGGLVGAKDPATMKILYQATSRWALTLTLPLFVLMTLWSGEILALFGQAFTLGASALLILAAAQLLNTATGPTTSIILMSGHSRTIMMNSVMNGVLLIGANFILIPKYGLLGAAIGSALCQVLISVVRVAQVWQLSGIFPFSWSMAKPIAAAFIAMVMGFFFKRGIGSHLYTEWALSVLVLGIFSGVLFRFGFDEVDHVTATGLWKRLTQGGRS